MNGLIKSTSEISLDWLNAFMPGAGISSFHVESTSEEFCSSIARIRLLSSETKRSSSIFLKFAKNGKDGKPTGSGSKEVKFYNAYSVTMGHPSIPRCFFAEYSNETHHYNIVLEDLSETHDHEEWPNSETQEQFGLVAECLAGIHAKWWNRLDAKEILGLRVTDEERTNAEQSTKMAAVQFIKNHSESIAPSLLKTFSDCEAVYDQILAMDGDSRNITVIHGDTHFWNFLYPKSHTGNVYLIDWESYTFDSPTHDLVKFAAVIWSPEKRKLYEEPFLKTYHRKLLEHGVLDYSFENLLFDYKISILKMLYLPVQKEGWGLPKEIWLQEFENIMSAIDDMNCIVAGRKLVADF